MDKSIDLSDELVKAAQELSGIADERAAVEFAVKAFVEDKQKRAKSALDGMLELAGTNPLRDDYDYKALRRGRLDDADH